jgi:hypothetical protein
MPADKRVDPYKATLVATHINHIQRAATTAVFFWGTYGPHPLLPNEWSPVWPAEAEATHRADEASDLFQACIESGCQVFVYVGVTNMPLFYENGWKVSQRKNGTSDWISDAWDNPKFVSDRAISAQLVLVDGIGLDASAFGTGALRNPPQQCKLHVALEQRGIAELGRIMRLIS